MSDSTAPSSNDNNSSAPVAAPVDNTPAPVSSTGATGPDVQAMTADIQQLYNTVLQKISIAVASHSFSLDTFEIIVTNVVETVEELNSAGVRQLTPAERRTLVLNLVQMVLSNLHDSGKLSDSLYNSLTEAVNFVGPMIFEAASLSYQKLHAVEEDIHEHGFKGCWKRNC